MLAGVIPEGPLHPDDAAFALVAGMLVGMAMRATGRWGAALVPAVTVLAFEARYPEQAWSSIDGRWTPLLAGVLVGAAAALPLGGPAPEPVPARLALLAAAPPVALVWGIVPDTEAAVIGGSVIAGAVLLGSARWDRRTLVVLYFVPVFAALVGSVGRPSRVWPALAGIAATAAVTALVVWFWRRRQRAGTPTTVEFAGTSDVTTAPAPTTAP